MFLLRSTASNLGTLTMDRFVTKVDEFQTLRTVIKSSILIVTGFLDLPLFFSFFYVRKNKSIFHKLPTSAIVMQANKLIIFHRFALLMRTLSRGLITSLYSYCFFLFSWLFSQVAWLAQRKQIEKFSKIPIINLY